MYVSPLQLRNFIPKYILKRNEGRHALKDMAQKVSTSFIYKSSKLERIQMTIVIKIDKWCHIYTMECYRAIKKNELLIHTAKEMTLPDIMLSEKPGTEEHEVEKQA